MFCGPSGTGKTLTANAIAASMSKKLLLVNMPTLASVGINDTGMATPFGLYSPAHYYSHTVYPYK